LFGIGVVLCAPGAIAFVQHYLFTCRYRIYVGDGTIFYIVDGDTVAVPFDDIESVAAVCTASQFHNIPFDNYELLYYLVIHPKGSPPFAMSCLSWGWFNSARWFWGLSRSKVKFSLNLFIPNQLHPRSYQNSRVPVEKTVSV
jgi:hypothetical protein